MKILRELPVGSTLFLRLNNGIALIGERRGKLGSWFISKPRPSVNQLRMSFNKFYAELLFNESAVIKVRQKKPYGNIHHSGIIEISYQHLRLVNVATDTWTDPIMSRIIVAGSPMPSRYNTIGVVGEVETTVPLSQPQMVPKELMFEEVRIA